MAMVAVAWVPIERRDCRGENMVSPERNPIISMARRAMVTPSPAASSVSFLESSSSVWSRGRQANTFSSRPIKTVRVSTKCDIRVRNLLSVQFSQRFISIIYEPNIYLVGTNPLA